MILVCQANSAGSTPASRIPSSNFRGKREIGGTERGWTATTMLALGTLSGGLSVSIPCSNKSVGRAKPVRDQIAEVRGTYQPPDNWDASSQVERHSPDTGASAGSSPVWHISAHSQVVRHSAYNGGCAGANPVGRIPARNGGVIEIVVVG